MKLFKFLMKSEDRTYETTLVIRAETAASPYLKDKLEQLAEQTAMHGLKTYFRVADKVIKELAAKEEEEKRKKRKHILF